MNLKESIKKNIPFKSIKEIMPWWLKVGSKIFIYRLPITDQFWKSIGFFQYDQMEIPEYAYRAFQQHFNRVSQFKQLEPGFTSLELGPGNSLFSALICRSLGGDKTYLVDAENFVMEEPEIYQEMASYLAQQNLAAPKIENSQSVAEVMDNCGGVYLTSGLDSLKEIEDHSVDFVWSHAVLEHVRRSEFLEIMQETRRVISNDGVCSHTVDLKDHLDESLNNLRFQENFWESSFVEKSGIYTNRIRCAEMLDIFKEAGFEVKATQVNKWQNLPISRTSLAKKFQHLSDDELCISGFSVLLIPV
jgi:predicted SAM-dependent methyltransferase